MMVEVSSSFIFSILSLLFSAASIVYSYMNSARRLEHRLTSLEHKIEPVWDAIRNEIPKLLLRPHTAELDELIEKSMNGLKTMNEVQVNRLLQLLDAEYTEAVAHGYPGRAMAIVFMRIGIKADIDLIAIKNQRIELLTTIRQ